MTELVQVRLNSKGQAVVNSIELFDALEINNINYKYWCCEIVKGFKEGEDYEVVGVKKILVKNNFFSERYEYEFSLQMVNKIINYFDKKIDIRFYTKVGKENQILFKDTKLLYTLKKKLCLYRYIDISLGLLIIMILVI